MQKTKSMSLSQKDRGKIITIIDSKITPLKFKHNPFQKERHYYMSKSLPKLTYQKEKIFAPLKKRFSISTIIEKTSPKHSYQRSKLEADFRNEILTTQSLVEQQKFLKLSQTCQSFNTFNSTGFSEFYQHEDPFPVKKNQKIMSDFEILQTKKKLKDIKSEIYLKKSKLFDQIQIKKQQKRQEQLLHKKYTQNSKQILKEKFSHQKISSQFLSLLHIDDSLHKSQDNRISIGSIEEIKSQQKQEIINSQDDDTEITIFKQNKLKDFLRYFQTAGTQSRPNSSTYQFNDQYLKINDLTQTNDNTMNSQLHMQNDKSQSVEPIFFDKDNLIYKGLCRMIQQKMKKINEQNKNEIINAKMRIRFNHKKIVNLGKTQKFPKF